MGQAWCKERTSKAQDSKSPLDRVFVRCAHRIYPGLKEEGSVLGGATQRVTSSEIGYAGSPPREALTRGRSIDSVDRPFHPSDWVDVNLEVPSTPRASSVLTNLTADTSLYPATTPTSSCSNLKDATPVPPPRRRKRNRGRPLPPKPDEVQENVSNNSRHAEVNEEPLYSSVKLPRRGSVGVGEGGVATPGAKTAASAGEEEPTLAKIHEGRRTKEIYEHKVNGTGRIIPSEVVSGKREKRSSDFSNHQRKFLEVDEYEKFARGQSAKDSSTPNRRANGRGAKDVERPKNYSTVSLPNYDELDASRHRDGVPRIRRERGQEEDEEVVLEEEDGRKVRSRRPVRCSTVSLPAESFLSPFSQKTSVRLEDYVQRRGSAEHLLPYQVLGKLSTSQNGIDDEDDDGFVKYDPSKLEDWDLSDIGNCELNHRRRSYEAAPPLPRIIGEDVVDHCAQDGNNRDGEWIVGREVPRIVEDRGGGKGEGGEGPGERTASPQKPVAFGKIAQSSVDFNRDSNDLDNWIVGQNRSSRYFDPPTMEICKTSSPSCQANARREPFFLNERKDDRTSFDTIGGSCRSTEAIGETDRSVEPSRTIFGRSLSNESEPYDDPYESKELRVDPEVTGKLIRTISEESLPREMLQEVVDSRLDDFFDEKLSKDAHNKLKKDQSDQKIAAKTPPPSPEPKIKAEILDNDHSILLKVLKDEHAEESNLSSMTPSLTELEAALSDMLEKEDTQDIAKDQERVEKREELEKGSSILRSNENPIEPKIVPIEKAPGGFASQGGSTVSEAVLACDRILVDERGSLGVEEPNDSTKGLSPGPCLDSSRSPAKARKVSFCAWEESRLEREGGEESIGDREDSKTTTTFVESDKRIIASPPMDRLREEESFQDLLRSPGTVCSASSSEIAAELLVESKGEARTDDAPEKPSRLHRANIEESIEGMESVPTPPRRKHRSTGAGGGAAAVSKDAPTPPATQNGSKSPELDPFAPNDRLI